MIPVVRQCCWDRQICTHYENVPTVQYEEFSIRFEGRALSAETVDEFEVISHDSARSEIQVLKSSDTYRIQFDAEKARFKLRSGHE